MISGHTGSSASDAGYGIRHTKGNIAIDSNQTKNCKGHPVLVITRYLETRTRKRISGAVHQVPGYRDSESGIGQSASSITLRASSPRRHGAAAGGFTLMEILLAFLILGIVITTILASFNAVFSTTDSLENSARYYDMAKSCLNRMTLDLGALYVSQPPIYKAPEFDDPPDPYRIVGATSEIGGTSFANLRFASNAHIPFNGSTKGGVAEIVYYVQGDSDGQRVLRRRDHLYPYPEFEENNGDPVLSEDVKSLAFKYFDDEGEEFEEWDSDSAEYDHATPTAIGIQLEIGNESLSYMFETTVRLAVRRKKIES